MGLYVVGMHRSGTSAVTEALASLPFDLPPAEAMVGGNESNPRGHWEVEALVDFNEELLARSGGAWYAPSSATLEDIARLDYSEIGLDVSALGHFRGAFGTDAFLFKDPRLCLTLPFWKSVVPCDQAVLVLRDPLSIARSLRSRNKFPLSFGLALWERYMRSAVDALRGMRVHVTTFSDVVAGGQAVIDLFNFSAENLGVGVPPDFEARSRSLIDGTLRHHVSQGESESDLMSDRQRELEADLSRIVGTHDNFSVELNGQESDGLELAFLTAAGFGRQMIDQVWSQRKQLEDDYASREKVWSRQFAEQADRLSLQSDSEDLFAEIDRVRDIAAAAELSLALHRDRAEVVGLEAAGLAQELAMAADHRDFLASQLDKLQSRRAVKLALRCDELLRQTPLLSQLEIAEPAAKVRDAAIAPRRRNYGPLALAIREGRLDRPLTVIIPVHDAIDAFQRCLESFRRWTPDTVRLIVIDDASRDERLEVVLNQLTERPNTLILRNGMNLGFSGTVNRGLEAVEEAQAEQGVLSDVILLNSDTVLTPRWTQRLRSAANEDPTIATVTPLSNAAGAFSFGGPLPVGLDEAAVMATAVTRASSRTRPAGPTGNGFCLFIKAEALQAVPRLDAEAFPRGYGEENDLCMKLDAEGWTHVVADDVAVFHEESASFGDDTRSMLIEQGLAKLATRWPSYDQRAREFVESEEFVSARQTASVALQQLHPGGGTDEPQADLRIRTLIVLHDGGGGTDFHSSDLWMSLRSDYRPFLLITEGDELVLWDVDSAPERLEKRRWKLASKWDVRAFTDPQIAEIITELLIEFDIELVHAQHLIGHTFDVPRIARTMGIPVILSLHDYYLACPSVNLIDDAGRWCGGTCTPGQGQCPSPAWVNPGLGLKHQFVHLWRHETKALLTNADELVTPSLDTKEHFARLFGPEIGERIEAIEHGRDFDRSRSLAHSPADDEPIRILMVGAINQSKGASMMANLAREGAERNVGIEVLGEIEPGYAAGVTSHGRYKREELSERLALLRPTFVGVFSIWAETHCYVVSEAWANGIPVIVGPLGAPAERVKKHGAGFVVSTLDPERIVDEAIAVARDRLAYARLASQATRNLVRTTEEMAQDYRVLYSRASRAHGGRAGAVFARLR